MSALSSAFKRRALLLLTDNAVSRVKNLLLSKPESLGIRIGGMNILIKIYTVDVVAIHIITFVFYCKSGLN